MSKGPDLAHQEVAGWVFGQVWNQSNLLFGWKPGSLAGYLDPLFTLQDTNVDPKENHKPKRKPQT